MHAVYIIFSRGQQYPWPLIRDEGEIKTTRIKHWYEITATCRPLPRLEPAAGHLPVQKGDEKSVQEDVKSRHTEEPPLKLSPRSNRNKVKNDRRVSWCDAVLRPFPGTKERFLRSFYAGLCPGGRSGRAGGPQDHRQRPGPLASVAMWVTQQVIEPLPCRTCGPRFGQRLLDVWY